MQGRIEGVAASHDPSALSWKKGAFQTRATVFLGLKALRNRKDSSKAKRKVCRYPHQRSRMQQACPSPRARRLSGRQQPLCAGARAILMFHSPPTVTAPRAGSGSESLLKAVKVARSCAACFVKTSRRAAWAKMGDTVYFSAGSLTRVWRQAGLFQEHSLGLPEAKTARGRAASPSSSCCARFLEGS